MNTRPDDLSDAEVAAALTDAWKIAVSSLEYAAVGFGSYHWFADDGETRWFLTAHDLDRGSWLGPDTLAALQRAFTVARALHDEADLPFVVAQQATPRGDIVVRLGGHYALSIYPYVDGVTHAEYSDAQRDEVLRMVASLHGATETVAGRASVDDLLLPDRAALDQAMADVGVAWDGGPYAEPARALLNDNVDLVRHALAAYDDFARAALTAPDDFVITHGEPHPQNVVFSEDGPRLIDWDTAKLAPPERDLARIVTDVDDAAAAYDGALDLDRLTMYGLWWDLAEIAGYITEFRRPHTKTADTDTAFHWLNHFIRVGEHWPALLD